MKPLTITAIVMCTGKGAGVNRKIGPVTAAKRVVLHGLRVTHLRIVKSAAKRKKMSTDLVATRKLILEAYA